MGKLLQRIIRITKDEHLEEKRMERKQSGRLSRSRFYRSQLTAMNRWKQSPVVAYK